MGKERVCLLDRSPPIQRLIQLILEQDNIEPLLCLAEEELLEAVQTNNPELLLIDVGLPSENGVALLERVRSETDQPIIATSAGNHITDARACLEAGADDYVSKPFDPDVLLEHVHFLLGRPPASGEKGLYGDRSTRVDLNGRTLTARGEHILVSRTEWQLLRSLALKSGEPVFNADLARSAFDRELRNDADYLRLWMNRLQAKLGGDPFGTPLLRRIHEIAYGLDVRPVSD